MLKIVKSLKINCRLFKQYKNKNIYYNYIYNGD